MKKTAANAMLSSLGRLKELAKEDTEVQVSEQDHRGDTSDEAPRNTDLPTLLGSEGYPLYDAACEYGVGDRLLLPIEMLQDNPNNPRVFYLEAGMESLLSSLATAGQLTAAQAYFDKDSGNFMLKSGHRRKRALRMLGKSHIKVEIVAHAPSLLDEYKQARDLNVEHKSQTHFDDAVRFKALIEDGVARDQKALSLELNIPEAEISKILRIGMLPEVLLEEMAEHITHFGLTASYHIYRYWVSCNKNVDRTQALIRRVVERALSVRQLEKLVKDDVPLAGVAPRARMLERLSLTGPGKVELKAYEERIVLQVEELPRVQRESLFAALVTALESAGFDKPNQGTLPESSASEQSDRT